MSTFVHISEASTIAIHSLALIANTKRSLNAGKIADVTRFSKNHLAKVLHILVKHNYLDSLRGPNGGFTLKKDPASITLLEIYQLIEGELVQFECAITCHECYFESCIFGNYPHKFSGDFKRYLQDKTLIDFKLNKAI
ncbi:MAG: Rrf2 family transcriptional regulator [Bacteroidales bacterium]|nr:Rrf2 family transcriptional regulator [Bacteroidales bacterium]